MLRTAVQSVLDQTYRPIEIIVVDDGSTDDTPEAAKQLMRQHPEIVKFHQKTNSGPGPTREAGRVLAKGEFLQYLDSDDRLLPNKCADQVAALRENPECDIAYGITRLVDEHQNVLADPFKWTDRCLPGLFPGLLVDRWWCTHTPMYRRTLTDKIGPWCDMRWSQDWDYDARAGALGAKLINCGTHVSEHVHHSGERQTSGAAWTTDPVRLRNRVRLLSLLWSNGQSAGIDGDLPEKQHFARWCFTIARQCAAQAMKPETLALLEIAEASAGQGAGKKGIREFRMASRMLGVRFAGKLFRQIDRLRKTGGDSTMEQSFARQA